jgi:TPR repeat protein
MLHWLRRPGPTPKYDTLEKILADLLHIQRSFIVDFELMRTDGSVKEGALGYIYGFIDCATQIAKLEIDCDEGIKLITNILESLQSGCGQILALRSIDLLKKSNKDFVNATRVGGNEYNDWVRLKGGFTPLALGRYFYGHRERATYVDDDPLIEQADTLVHVATGAAIGMFMPLFERFSVIHKVNEKQFDFFVTIASVFIAATRLRNLNLGESREGRLMDIVSKHLAEWNPKHGFDAFEDCKSFFDRKVAEVSHASDPHFATADTIGAWVAWNILNRPPETKEDLSLVRAVGVMIVHGFFSWWDIALERNGASRNIAGATRERQPSPASADEFQELIKAAERGDVDAQVRLSVAYRTGQGGAQDDERAVHWARRAAEQGNDRGQALLASAYTEGRGVPKDAVAAAGWHRRSAEQGNAIAQRQLAIAYINGEGVQRNANEAVKWYRAAAEQGDVIAQIGLGVSYYRGDGVLQDYAEAAKWYERAAAYGDQNAQGRLADFYARGVGVSQDKVTALMWLILAGEDVSDDNREIVPAYRARLTASLTSSDVAEAERRAMAWEPRTWPSDPIKDGLLRLLPRRRATVRPQQPR